MTPRMLFTLLFTLMLALPASAADHDIRLANDDLELDIDLSLEDGHVILRDKASGEEFTAVDFGVIRAYDVTEDRMRTLLISPESQTSRCGVTIEKKSDTHAVIKVDTGNGSPSAMGQMSFGVKFDVHLKLNGNAFEYSVPIASVEEMNLGDDLPQRWRLMNLELFPCLGQTPAGSPGYLVIPSWSGALYYFDRDHPRSNPGFLRSDYGDLGTEAGVNARWAHDPEAPAEYGSMVYGIQAVWEDQLQFPVYATVRDKAALAGIILSGDYDTEIRARRHQGKGDMASINPVLHYRKHWHSKLDPVDRTVRLTVLPEKDAHYAGVANLYRDYLVKEKNVPTLKERAAKNAEVAYFMDSIYLRVMMGMKGMDMRGQGKMNSRMTWDEFAAAIPMFQEAGFEKINFIFVGANFEGHDGAHPTVFPLEKDHGGTEMFKRMMAKINDAGYRATFHLNYKDVYMCSPDWTPEAIQVNEFGELRFHGAWIGGYSYQGIPQEMLERFGKRDLPKLRELGLKGMHYWDACLSVMEETFPPGRVITRREYGEGAMAYFKYAASIFGTVGCETTISPLLGIIVNAGNTSYPHGGAPGKFKANGYCEAALLDHWVPMLHMIYHGMACYGGGPEIAGRTGYEFNAAPTQEEVDLIRERYETTQQWLGDLQYEFMNDHRRLAGKVDRTTFSDGTRIYVNKSAEEVEVDGVTLAPRGYSIIRP